MNGFVPLFADAGDVIKIIVILLIFVVPLIRQLLASIPSIGIPRRF